MPILKSAKKALRQSQRRRVQNLRRAEVYKNVIRDIKKATGEGKINDAKALFPKLYKALDKAAKSNTISKNKAARLKSRLSKLVEKTLKKEN